MEAAAAGVVVPRSGQAEVAHREEGAHRHHIELAVVVRGVGGSGDPRGGAVGEVDRPHAFGDVEFAAPPGGVGAAPVAQPVGGVAVLLDLEDQVARADRVGSAGGDEIGVARIGFVALEQRFDLRRGDLLAHQLLGGPETQAGEDLRAAPGRDHVPHLGFGFGAAAEGRARGGVGMHLQTQPFPGVDQLHQKRETLAAAPHPPEERLTVVDHEFAERAQIININLSLPDKSFSTETETSPKYSKAISLILSP